MYSNGLLLKEISECIESFELLLNYATSSSIQIDLPEEDLKEIQSQFFKLKCCDHYLLIQNLRRHSSTGKLNTIIHGELWDRNLMLNKENKVKILDWKNAKLASATLDLAFLMLSSTTFEVREDGTTDLLNSYLEVFNLTLEKFNVSADEKLTLPELLEDYQISLQVAVLQALCMFVQEMHYMTQNIAKAVDQNNSDEVDDLSERLKIYELRALTLFKDLDLSQIEDDLGCAGSEMDPTSLSPSSPAFDEF